MPKVHDPDGLLREDVYIYGLCGPDGVVRYIGSTCRNPKGRLSEHIKNATNGASEMVAVWIRALLANDGSPEMIILERCERVSQTMHPREAHWIAAFGGVAALLNRTANGSGGGPWMKGKPQPQSVRDAVSAAQKGRKRTPAQLEVLRGYYLKHRNECGCIIHRKAGT